MRILLINPNTTPEITELVAGHARTIAGQGVEKFQVHFLYEAVLCRRARPRLAESPDPGLVQGGQARADLREVAQHPVRQLPRVYAEVLRSRASDEEQAARGKGEEAGGHVRRRDGGPSETFRRSRRVYGALDAG